MSWQTPARVPADPDPAPVVTGPTDPDHPTTPVILRTVQAKVFLGLLQGDSRGPGYGHQVVLHASRPVYSWPREGLHHLAAYAAAADLATVRLGPAIHEHWIAGVSTVWGLTPAAYDRLADLAAVSQAEGNEDQPDARPVRVAAVALAAQPPTAAAGIARVAEAIERRAAGAL